MTPTQGGVDEVTTASDNNKALTDIMVTLARLEEGIKPLAHLPQLLQDVKEVAKDASGQADKANTRLDVLEPATMTTKDLAEDAQREAFRANQRLDSLDENQKWFKRLVYGGFIAFAVTGVGTVVWTGFQAVMAQ